MKEKATSVAMQSAAAMNIVIPRSERLVLKNSMLLLRDRCDSVSEKLCPYPPSSGGGIRIFRLKFRALGKKLYAVVGPSAASTPSKQKRRHLCAHSSPNNFPSKY
eukprot:2474657-Rhodomonas_salina.4